MAQTQCSTWSDPQETTVAVSGLDTNTQTLDFTATNGVDYAFVLSQPMTRTINPRHLKLKGTARDECDFAECYPGRTPDRTLQCDQPRTTLATLRYFLGTEVAPHLEPNVLASLQLCSARPLGQRRLAVGPSVSRRPI